MWSLADGHGPEGEDVSNYLVSNLFDLVKIDEIGFKQNTRNSLQSIHDKIQDMLIDEDQMDKSESGSSLISILFKDETL